MVGVSLICKGSESFNETRENVRENEERGPMVTRLKVVTSDQKG